ncbi:ERF family protein [Bradyrhizobium sp. HKCCYLRH2015]|uniref:ERF family protein n=1 Tax=Bradyrhizobium sp. HKCCYLRH2015 TaxID=3420742 RepID=UPI003EBEF5AF
MVAAQTHPSPAPAQPAGTLDIVRAAMATGDVDMLREAAQLAKELDAIAARKAFNNALADAKTQLPTIRRNRMVDETRGSDRATYSYEDLAEVVEAVVPILSAHGLSHRWKLSGRPGEPVSVTCVISHRDGHQEENEISANADQTGGKNSIQGIKSAVSYLERITLMASLGLASKGGDDDGRGTNAPASFTYAAPPGSITEEQAAFIRTALKEKNASECAFLQFAASKGIFSDGRKQTITEIPAEKYGFCINTIAGFKKA